VGLARPKGILNGNAELTVLDSEFITFAISAEIFGNFLYVGGAVPRLSIFDISSPDNIELLFAGTVGPAFSLGFSLSGNVLIGSDAARIDLMDVREPSSPTLLSTLPITGVGVKTYLDGQNLYVRTTTALLIYDISDPTNLVLRSTTSIVSGNTFGGVFVINDLCVAMGDERIDFIDVTDPDSPSIVSSLTTADGLSVGEQPTNNPQGYGRLVFCPTEVSGAINIRIIDISDFSAPSIVGTISGGTVPVFMPFILMPPYLWYSAEISSVTNRFMYDISDPTTPVEIFRKEAPSTAIAALGLAMSGNIEAGAGGSRAWTMEISGEETVNAQFGNLQVGRANFLNDSQFQGKTTYLGSADFRNQLSAGGDVSTKKNVQAENEVFAYRDRPAVRYGLIIGGDRS
jgi:hypothetical protein